MDQVHVIRHKVLVEKKSRRAVAREMGVSRNTVREYLERPTPQYGPRPPGTRPVWAKVGARILALLATVKDWTVGKQRLTATQLHRMLIGEGHKVGITVVREAVAEWKRQQAEVYVPLVYHPGQLAEVDFFEVFVGVGEVRRKAWLFVMRLMHSGRDFAWIYDRQDQVSFLDGHVRAFAHFGAVPERIAYDNLRLAVRRILVGDGRGTQRELTVRFEALMSHYLFEASFCRPATGHDKGGVEARGRGIRLRNLVPIPTGPTLQSINTVLLAALDKRLETEPGVGERFVAERAAMLPLPVGAFDARATRLVTATRSALLRIDGAFYSVPCEWHGLGLTARIGPDEVEVVGPTGTVVHPRMRGGARSVDYRHYIRELARKPQAVRQVSAELCRDLGEPFPTVWRRLVDEQGPRQASRILAKVLGHVESLGLVEVARIVDAASSAGDPLLLALAPVARQPTLPLDAVPAHLRSVEVEAASAAEYDSLLGGVA
jgi:transposase